MAYFGIKNKDLPVVIVGGLLLLMVFGVIAVPSALQGIVPVASDSAAEPAGSCDLSGNTQTWDVSAADFFNPGTTLTESAYLWLNGDYEGTITGGTGKAVDPTDGAGNTGVYEALVWNGTTYSTTGYYKGLISNEMECKSADVEQAKLGLQGSVTLTYFNSDDGLVNSATDTEAIGSGEAVQGTLTLKQATADAYLTNPENPKFYLMTAWNATEFQTADSGPQGCAAVSVPQGQVGTYYGAWECDWTLGGDFNTATIPFTLAAATGTNPLVGSTNVTIKFMDEDYFMTNANEIGFGPEDTDTNADVGMSDTSNTVTVYKA